MSEAEAILALVGTRKRVAEIVEDVTATLAALDRSTIIVTGDATGTDAHVRRECERLGFRYIECHVRKIDGEWAGSWAGPERNEMIARLGQRAIAWPLDTMDSGRSLGTYNCVRQFVSRGKAADVRQWWTFKKEGASP